MKTNYGLLACMLVVMVFLAACALPETPANTRAAQLATSTLRSSSEAAQTSVQVTTTSETYAPLIVSADVTPTGGSTYAPLIISSESTPTSGTTYAPLIVGSDITPTPIPVIPLRIRDQTLLVELATTEAQRTLGYMNRTTIPVGTGMLFVFSTDQQLNFWMRNTPAALSIAFIDADKRILNLADMQPYDDKTIHQSQGPARYALEVPQGWFATHNIRAGDTVEFSIPEGIPIE